MEKHNYSILDAEEIIENNQKWFNFYLIAPKLITIILAILYFLEGIIFSIELKNFLYFILFCFGGGLSCVIAYIISKIAFSHKILQIYYLRLLSLQNYNIQLNENPSKSNNQKNSNFISQNTKIIQNEADCFRNDLTDIQIPYGVQSIENYAFEGCSNLARITIPDSVTRIEEGAFSGCKRLKNIEIPNSVIRIGGFAFYDCSSLMSVTFDGTIAQWNSISKGSYWNDQVPATKVHCTDGDVKI